MSTTPTSPTNASELIAQTGIDPNEGVQVAIFPVFPESYGLGDTFAYGPGIHGQGVFAEIGTWGRRLLDILTEPATGIKWWIVRDYAAASKVDLVPISWSGAAQDIPEKYFSEPLLGIRLFSEGPWFWPNQPTVEASKQLEANLKVLDGFTT